LSVIDCELMWFKLLANVFPVIVANLRNWCEKKLLKSEKCRLSSPNIGNTLYGDSDQMNNTAQFYMLAMSQRAKAQVHAGSRQ